MLDLLLLLTAASANRVPPLTDVALLRLNHVAAGKPSAPRVVGMHRGIVLKQRTFCEFGLCAKNPKTGRWLTFNLIYYDLPPHAPCEAKGGVTQLQVFSGDPASRAEYICIPPVIAKDLEQAKLAAERALHPPVKPVRATPINPGTWITASDHAFQEYRITIRLEVSPFGRAASCDVKTDGGRPDLAAETCRIVTKRARFKPATDATGQPATGSYDYVAMWKPTD